LLEWTFSPADFFEQRLEVDDDHYFMEIDNGLVRAVVDAAVFDADAHLGERIKARAVARFKAQKLAMHKAFQLGNEAQKRIGSDGHVGTLFLADTVEVACATDRFDGVAHSADGQILNDSRAERLAANKAFGEHVAAHSADALLVKLLDSFTKAVDDPGNELVHLYEIRDALATTFGGDTKARTRLNVTRSDWSRLGVLSNVEPLRQGRHRGEAVAGLRDANASELEEARAIARRMLDAYLNRLDAAATQRKV